MARPIARRYDLSLITRDTARSASSPEHCARPLTEFFRMLGALVTHALAALAGALAAGLVYHNNLKAAQTLIATLQAAAKKV